MDSFLTTLTGWFKTIVSFLTPKPAAVTVTTSSGVNPVATLISIMLNATEDLGPMPTTGGVIHKISTDTAADIAQLIVDNAPKYGLSYALIAAGLRGESDFDPDAMNPNNQDAAKNETPTQAFTHYDVGLAQFDGSVLLAETQFKNLTPVQIEAIVENPSWAVPAFCEFVMGLIKTANAQVSNDPSILVGVPGNNVLVLALQMYNSGPTGAKNMAIARGSFSYGLAWLNRANAYAALLNPPAK